MNERTKAQTEAIAQADAEATNAGLPAYSELLRAHEYEKNYEAEKDRNLERAREEADAQASSITEMVAALNCDYDRLEELRDERERLQWDVDNAESEAAKQDPTTALSEWDAENAEELQELEQAAGECSDEDEARQRIQEDPLSIEVRGGWVNPGETSEPEEFKILLCTGGPAAQIRGELDRYKQPSRAWLEYQDWFTPWTEYHGDKVSSEDLLTYCQQFYFGE